MQLIQRSIVISFDQIVSTCAIRVITSEIITEYIVVFYCLYSKKKNSTGKKVNNQ